MVFADCPRQSRYCAGRLECSLSADTYPLHRRRYGVEDDRDAAIPGKLDLYCLNRDYRDRATEDGDESLAPLTWLASFSGSVLVGQRAVWAAQPTAVGR